MASSSPSSSSGPRYVEPSSSSSGPRNVEPLSSSSVSCTVEPSSSSSVSFTVEPSSSSSDPWIPEYTEKFENAAWKFFNVDPPERWQYMADETGGGMTAEEAKMRYELMVEITENLRKAKFPSETIKDEENEDSVSTEQ